MRRAEILVVEDEGLVALEIKEGLEKLGYQVPHTVSTAERAINLALSEQPDLVLMDIHLEGLMDGIEAAKQIRQNFYIPVIFLTAYSDKDTLVKASFAESYGFLLKPFDDRALKAAIEVALYKARKDKELKHSCDWQNYVLESTNESYIVLGLKGAIQYLNPAASKLLDWYIPDVFHKNLYSLLRFIDKHTQEPISFHLENVVLKNETIYKDCNVVIIKNNVQIDAKLIISPLKRNNSTTIGILINLKKIEPIDN